MPAAKNTYVPAPIIAASNAIAARVVQLRKDGENLRADGLAEADGIIFRAVIESGPAAAAGGQAADTEAE
jgi:hypothetical protein